MNAFQWTQDLSEQALSQLWARSPGVELRYQPFRRDRAVALLDPVAQQVRRRGALLRERDTHPARLAQSVPGGLGAGEVSAWAWASASLSLTVTPIG